MVGDHRRGADALPASSSPSPWRPTPTGWIDLLSCTSGPGSRRPTSPCRRSPSQFLRPRGSRSEDQIELPSGDLNLAMAESSSTLFLWISTFCALLGLYVLLNWLPSLLRRRAEQGGKPGDDDVQKVDWWARGHRAGAAHGTPAARPGRRRLVRQPDRLIDPAGLVGTTSRSGVYHIFVAFTSSVAIMLYGLAPSYYPVTIRATGVGATVAVGRLPRAIIGPPIATVLLDAAWGRRACCWPSRSRRS